MDMFCAVCLGACLIWNGVLWCMIANDLMRTNKKGYMNY